MTQGTQDRIEDRSARVAVVGQGYVGLVVAMGCVDAGFAEVVGYELDPTRCAWLAAGRTYIEDVTDEQLAAALERGYQPTSDPGDLAGFDVAVITVPTPLDEGQPDLSAVRAAAQQVGEHLTSGSLVILESTTYPGTTTELVAPVLEEASGLVAGRDFLLGYSPERIDPGNQTWNLRTTPKVVGGIDDASADALVAFYDSLADDVVRVSSTAIAEMTKLLENTFRHVNIALVNELAVFARQMGVDVWEAIDAASTKPFGFMRFTPGPGVGGHCLPVDPTYLSWRVQRALGESFRFVELANDVNDHMPAHVIDRVTLQLNDAKLPVNGSNVVVLGLAYKPNTADARQSPARPIIEQLVQLGAQVTVVDPHVREPALGADVAFVTETTPQLLRDADLVLLVTDHDAFDFEQIERSTDRIFDARNRFGALELGNVERL